MKTLRLDSITINNQLNIRADELDQTLISQYVDTFKELPPIAVFKVGEEHVLVDGWHRLEAAKRLCLNKVGVRIVGTGTITDAADKADTANLSHGKMLTRDQRKQIALRFVERHPDWSERQIARWMAVDHHTIARWKAELVAQDTVGGGENAPLTGVENMPTPALEQPVSNAQEQTNRQGGDDDAVPVLRRTVSQPRISRRSFNPVKSVSLPILEKVSDHLSGAAQRVLDETNEIIFTFSQEILNTADGVKIRKAMAHLLFRAALQSLRKNRRPSADRRRAAIKKGLKRISTLTAAPEESTQLEPTGNVGLSETETAPEEISTPTVVTRARRRHR